MKVKELHGKTSQELAEKLEELLREQFKLRMQQATGQLGQTHLLNEVRRDIARVKTVMTQMESANG